MQLYYSPNLIANQVIGLDTNTSKHLIQVLRMKIGELIQLTDGLGHHATAEIIDDNKWGVQVKCGEVVTTEYTKPKFTIAVSFTKNKARNEWMLEKMVEIGVHSIIPIITQRTEKEKFNLERCQTILQSAMLQSKQFFQPIIVSPLPLTKFDLTKYSQKFVAHCEDESQKNNLIDAVNKDNDTLVFIGPEGDFTPNEIDWLLQQGCKPVSLGSNRLRTETAAIYAVTILNTINEK